MVHLQAKLSCRDSIILGPLVLGCQSLLRQDTPSAGQPHGHAHVSHVAFHSLACNAGTISPTSLLAPLAGTRGMAMYGVEQGSKASPQNPLYC